MSLALATCLTLSLLHAPHRDHVPRRATAPRCILFDPLQTSEQTSEQALGSVTHEAENQVLILPPDYINIDSGGPGRGGDDDGSGSGGGGVGFGGFGGDGFRGPPPLYNLLLAGWKSYSTALDTSPLVAKAMTAGFVGGLGDLCAQRWTDANQAFDRERFLAVCFDGLLVSGPLLHMGYAWLERLMPCAGRGSMRNVLLQLAIDEFVFDPLFIGAFFFSTGAIERQHPWKETLPNLRAEYWPTLKGAFITSAAFTPIQFCSFRYLPVKCRVLVVNLCDILWYGAVSLGRHSERVEQRQAVA